MTRSVSEGLLLTCLNPSLQPLTERLIVSPANFPQEVLSGVGQSPCGLSQLWGIFRNFDHLAGNFGRVGIEEVRQQDSSYPTAGHAHDVRGIPETPARVLDYLVPNRRAAPILCADSPAACFESHLVEPNAKNFPLLWSDMRQRPRNLRPLQRPRKHCE